MRRIDKKWDDEKVKLKVDELLNHSDEGELFIEEVFSENITFMIIKLKMQAMIKIKVLVKNS